MGCFSVLSHACFAQPELIIARAIIIVFLSCIIGIILKKMAAMFDEFSVRGILNYVWEHFSSFCKFMWEKKFYVLLGVLVLFVVGIISYFYLLENGYDDVLLSYVCKNLKQRTLYNARKYVNNMRSFYNTKTKDMLLTLRRKCERKTHRKTTIHFYNA